MTTTSRLALLVLLASLILNLAFAHRKHQNVPPQDLNQTPPEDPNKMHPPDDPPPEEPKQKDPSPEEPAQKDQPPEDPKQKDPPPDDPKQKDPPSEDPKQSLPSIPKNHLPQNPKQNPPPTPENQKPQDPNPNPPQDKPPFHDRFKGHFSTVFAFGDSYTDTGNAQFMGSLTTSFSGSLSSPYGSTAFGKSSNRLSDGRLVIDYITDSLGLPVLPPYQSTTANFTNGANFAIAGATTLTGDLLSKMARSFLLKGTPLGVWTQMDWYKKFQTERFCKGLDQKTCADKLKTTLFWVGEIGINDYSRAVGSNIPLQSPLGCLPLDISLTPLSIRDRSGCSPVVNGAVTFHNQILQVKLEMYRKMAPDVTIIYADSWKAYYTIVNNSQKYQIEETQKTCCGSHIKPDDLNFNLHSLCGSSGTSICSNPSLYISWDGIHPTQSMNFHMTDLFINQGCCNPPFNELMKNRKSPL